MGWPLWRRSFVISRHCWIAPGTHKWYDFKRVLALGPRCHIHEASNLGGLHGMLSIGMWSKLSQFATVGMWSGFRSSLPHPFRRSLPLLKLLWPQLSNRAVQSSRQVIQSNHALTFGFALYLGDIRLTLRLADRCVESHCFKLSLRPPCARTRQPCVNPSIGGLCSALEVCVVHWKSSLQANRQNASINVDGCWGG